MTADELLELPPVGDGIDRWLFAGERIERRNANRFHSPAHAGVVGTLSRLIGNWHRGPMGNGYRSFGYGCPYRLAANPDTLVTFDTSVTRLPERFPDDAPWVEGPPVLAVEVIELDEDYAAVDRLVAAGLTARVEAIWVIDPFLEFVSIHRPDRPLSIIQGRTELTGDPELPGFRCKVAEIFE
jgi:Uma2 family endonuclease